jgi:O-antigen ligase
MAEAGTTPLNILIWADSQTRTGGNHMDKTGLVALIIGLVLCALGGYAIWIFLPYVIAAVEGLIGIVVFLFGIMLVIFGALIFRD